MSDIVDALENIREVWESELDVDLDKLEVAISGALVAAGQAPLGEPLPPDAAPDVIEWEEIVPPLDPTPTRDRIDHNVGRLIAKWYDRFYYDSDQEWLNTLDSQIAFIARSHGIEPGESPVRNMRKVRGE